MVDTAPVGRKLKICMVSKADSAGGGASRVAEDLTRGLVADGHFVKHFALWSGKGFRNGIYPLHSRFKILAYIFRLIQFFERDKLSLPNFLPVELITILRSHVEEKYDVFHFHDLSSAVSPFTLIVLSWFKPVVWTAHDVSVVTGGCLYPMGCTRLGRCGYCPQIGKWPLDVRKDRTRLLKKIKDWVHRSSRITLASPSTWMADLLWSSGALKRRPQVVYNGIDTEKFGKLDKGLAKRRLGVPSDKIIVLLSAGSFSDERKNVRLAFEALRAVKAKEKIHLFLMGDLSKDNLEAIPEEISFSSFGYVNSQDLQGLIYAAADALVFLSIADNQPLTVIEALAAGTAVISLRTGGIPEIFNVADLQKVLIVNQEVDTIANCIDGLINRTGQRPFVSQSERDRVNQIFSINEMQKNYLKLYRGIV